MYVKWSKSLLYLMKVVHLVNNTVNKDDPTQRLIVEGIEPREGKRWKLIARVVERSRTIAIGEIVNGKPSPVTIIPIYKEADWSILGAPIC